MEIVGKTVNSMTVVIHQIVGKTFGVYLAW